MNLIIDIGNTNTKFAVFDGSVKKTVWSLGFGCDGGRAFTPNGFKLSTALLSGPATRPTEG